MGSEWVIVAIVAVVVIFGASKLPQLARNVGKAQSEFKKGLKEGGSGDEPAASAPPPAQAPAPAEPTTPMEQPPAQPTPVEQPPADQTP
jgi:sec-independent protein translocase protein TatA